MVTLERREEMDHRTHVPNSDEEETLRVPRRRAEFRAIISFFLHKHQNAQ